MEEYELILDFEDVKPGMILTYVVGEWDGDITNDSWYLLYIVKEKTDTKVKGLMFQRKGSVTKLGPENVTKNKWPHRGFKQTKKRSNIEIMRAIF